MARLNGGQYRFHAVGVRYCLAHHGIANEDMDECDFAVGESGACKFRQLGYRARR